MVFNKNDVIGEGGYGCVHKPSLTCKKIPKSKSKSKFNYKSHISKIVELDEANRELKEILILGDADPDNLYHVGQPILCEPKLDKETFEALSKCKYVDINNIKRNPQNYRLLISKYGGEDLHKFFTYSLDDYLLKNRQQKVDTILISIHALIRGLKVFKEHSLVHNDLKPQNILFNIETGAMKFIDFGMMRNKKTILEESMKSKNWLGVYHWSLPLECGLMNKDEYFKYKNMSYNEKQLYNTKLAECIILEKNNKNNDFSISSPESFKTLFSYINPLYAIPNETTQYGYINSYFNGINTLMRENISYEKVLNNIVDSIDIYGLGFTLLFIINCLSHRKAIDLDVFMKLSVFFNKMCDFNILNRETDLDLLIAEYEVILIEIGILTRMDKAFLNNRLVKSPSKTVSYKRLSRKLEEKSYADPEPIYNCPKRREVNPYTRKWVKICKKGFKRNKTFKSIKNKNNNRNKNKNKKVRFQNDYK